MLPDFTREQWSRIEELFSTAVDLGYQEREAFLETISELELRHYLRKLLPHSGTASDRIAQAIGGAAQSVVPEQSWTGWQFGPYRIVKEIGRGGMGIVFEAI